MAGDPRFSVTLIVVEIAVAAGLLMEPDVDVSDLGKSSEPWGFATEHRLVFTLCYLIDSSVAEDVPKHRVHLAKLTRCLVVRSATEQRHPPREAPAILELRSRSKPSA
jgi:hypothetical protein